MQPTFKGFPPEAFQFFRGLRRNNKREWFQPRKEHFEQHVRAPMIELVEAVNRDLLRFAPTFVTDPRKAIFRIYRDTRFSADKTPYKDRISAWFGPAALEKMGAGGFYFSVNEKQAEIAAGVYHPGPETLRPIRAHIAETHQDFRRLLANRKLKTLLGELPGAELSRVPKGFAADHPAADLIRKKDWFFFTLLDAKMAATPAFLAELTTRFRAAHPVLEYLNAPLRASAKADALTDPLANYS